MYKKIFLFICICICMFMFGLKPVIADEEIKSYYGRSSTGNVEVDVYTEDDWTDDVYTEDDRTDDVFAENAYEVEISLIKVFLLNMTDLLITGDIYAIIADRIDIGESRAHINKSFTGLDDAFSKFIGERVSDEEKKMLTTAFSKLGNQYGEVEISCQSDRLRNLYTVLNFFNLDPSEKFLIDLDGLIVDEIGYIKSEYLRFEELIERRESIDFDDEMDKLISDLEEILPFFVERFFDELRMRDIPTETIMPLIGTDALDDNDAMSRILRFVIDHGFEIKSVFYDLIDNSEELHKILLIADDTVDLLIKIEMLDEIPRQLAHVEKLLERIIDLPHDEIKYDASINSGLSGLVDFANNEIDENGGIHLKTIINFMIKQTEWQLLVINTLFDKDRAENLFYNTKSVELDHHIMYMVFGGVYGEIIDAVLFELHDTRINIVKIVSKMPKTSELIGNSLQSGFSILGKVGFMANKIGNKVDELLPKHIEKVEDEIIQNMIKKDLAISEGLVEKLIGIMRELINEIN
jgi:hypothetical protein